MANNKLNTMNKRGSKPITKTNIKDELKDNFMKIEGVTEVKNILISRKKLELMKVIFDLKYYINLNKEFDIKRIIFNLLSIVDNGNWLFNRNEIVKFMNTLNYNIECFVDELIELRKIVENI